MIFFEDENFLAINKPVGLIVHPDSLDFKGDSVWLWLKNNRPELEKVGEEFVFGKNITVSLPRFGIAHRLDTDTTGVLLVAKNQETFDYLKSLFQNHQIKKTYHGFCYEWPKEEKGEINAPIGRSPKDFRRWSAQRGIRGNFREAVTNWKVLARFFDEKEGRFSLIEFNPLTGRTHQIRVHAKYFHHPIVSDALYAGSRSKALNFQRQALHARQIEFKLFGKNHQLIAPYPSDFAEALEKYCHL